jgi:hypothetical protein
MSARVTGVSGRNAGTRTSSGRVWPGRCVKMLDSWVLSVVNCAKKGAPSGRFRHVARRLDSFHVAAMSIVAL